MFLFCIFAQFLVAYIYGYLSLKCHMHDFLFHARHFFEPLSFYIFIRNFNVCVSHHLLGSGVANSRKHTVDAAFIFKMNYRKKQNKIQLNETQYEYRTLGPRRLSADRPRLSVVILCKLALRRERVENTRRQSRLLETVQAFYICRQF